MAVVVHVDLCTNRSGLDNSTHQSRPHNPFLKDRTNGRQQSGRRAQQSTTKPKTQNNKTNNTEQQKTAETVKVKTQKTYEVTKKRVCANTRVVAKTCTENLRQRKASGRNCK